MLPLMLLMGLCCCCCCPHDGRMIDTLAGGSSDGDLPGCEEACGICGGEGVLLAGREAASDALRLATTAPQVLSVSGATAGAAGLLPGRSVSGEGTNSEGGLIGSVADRAATAGVETCGDGGRDATVGHTATAGTATGAVAAVEASWTSTSS